MDKVFDVYHLKNNLQRPKQGIYSCKYYFKSVGKTKDPYFYIIDLKIYKFFV